MNKETKVTGKKYRVWDEPTSSWKRLSFWTKASDVECEDQKSVQDKINIINTNLSSLKASDITCEDQKSVQDKINTINTKVSSLKASEITCEDKKSVQDKINTINTNLSSLKASDITCDDQKSVQGQIDNINTSLNTKAALSHTHDERYYTETEIETKLRNYATTAGLSSDFNNLSNQIGSVARECSDSISLVSRNLSNDISSVSKGLTDNINTVAKNLDSTNREQRLYTNNLYDRVEGILGGVISAITLTTKNLHLTGNLINSTSTSALEISTPGTAIMLGTSGFRSAGNLNLGTSSYKWGTIYSTSSTISTSDRNQKKDINYLNISKKAKKYEDLYMKLNPCTYMFDKSTSDRIHTGFISQDVEDSLTEVGLTPEDFAAFCKDKKVVLSKDHEGNEIETEVPGEYEYSLRYEEFIALNTHMIQKTMKLVDELQQKLCAAEQKIAELETKISKQ